MVKCSKCGKEVEEYIEVRGEILCADCYEDEIMSSKIEMIEGSA